MKLLLDSQNSMRAVTINCKLILPGLRTKPQQRPSQVYVLGCWPGLHLVSVQLLGISLFCFNFHLCFFLAIFYLTYYHAQEFARAVNILLKVKLYIHSYSSYLTVTSYTLSRRTVVSREAKKKQHACALLGLCDHYSELFTRMAALNF